MERDEINTRQANLSEAKRALLERWKRGTAGPAAPEAIGRRGEAGPAPLSSAQQRFWFLDQLAPGNPAYNLHAVVRLTGRLDPGALEGSFQALLDRHEILRTAFRVEGEGAERGHPAQVVEPRASLEQRRLDLTDLPAEAREAAATRRLKAEVGRGFDLTTAPLMRTLLLRVGPEEHLLLLTLHHIVGDGWSMGVLLREVAALYQAAVEGRAAQLPPLPLQYADYAAWQRRSLAEGALEADLDYWRRRLAGAPGYLELPGDHPPPARRSFRGATCPVALSAELTDALTELGRQGGATLFMVLLAAFQTLLLRYTGEEDLVVGTPVAGRERQGVAGLIGLFVNTLVLRGDLAGDPAFRELLARVRRTALEAYEHQELPFERLVEELQPDRDRSRNPLFQVMFVLQNTPLPVISLPGLTLRQEELESGAAMFDMSLWLRERDGAVGGWLEYSTDLFEAATAERMVGHLGSLLAGAAADPEQRLSELPLLTGEERRQLVAWNDRTAPCRRDVCWHELFAAFAHKSPDTVAVVCGGETLTYGDLERRSNQLARRLRRLGVGPDVPVGLHVGRVPEMAVGMLGILKAGGAYLPLDEAYPRERLALIAEDARFPVLVTQGRLAEDLEVAGATVIRLDTEAGELDEEDGAPIASVVAPDNLAYVIYTSGSTGRPKGVACLHQGLVNFMTDMERRRPLEPGEACGLWTSISFDVSVWEIFSALCYGGALHIPGEEERTRGEDFFPWLVRHRIRSIYLPPFQLDDFRRWVAEEGEDRRVLARLLVGVEPIPERVLVGLLEALPGLSIINGYGPTEATICATFYDVGPGPVPERRTPLGLALANCQVYLLDSHSREVPVGVPGEIWIGGMGLARGYLGRPDLTAASFVPDPIGAPGAGPGARCYRTGDIARRHPDGNLEFLGRRDQQVKVRGLRIELREIEAILGLHPEVRESVVTVLEDPRGEKRLVAYIVAAEGSLGDVSAWREFLRERLPDPMVPSIFVAMDALPMTPSSKVDRRALPAPDWSVARPQGELAPTRSPFEGLLADIWAELLECPSVGIHDDFFALGGHSLLATQVASRVRDVFEVELPLNWLFDAPTVGELARKVEALKAEGKAVAPPIRPVPRDGGLPLSFAQQRLWFLDQLAPGIPAYNLPWAARLRGDLDVRLLERTFREVVRRHEALRTRFEASPSQTSQGVPEQVILPRLPLRLATVSLQGLPAAARSPEARRLTAAEALRAFDLAADPLIRLTLLRVEEGEHLLLVTVHHIAADGWSLGVLVREVATLYRAFAAGEASPLPELPVQYADFAVWQRGWLEGEVLEEQLAYWRRALPSSPRPLELPTDRPRPAEPGFHGGMREVALAADLATGLAGLSRREGATLFMTLMAAFGVLLGRLADGDDVLVGTPIAGRNRREIEDLIGFFVNTLVLRVDFSDAPTFRQLLARVRQTALDAYAHQDLPFERLVDSVAPDRDLSHSPLFQVTFALQTPLPAIPDLPDLAMEPLPPAGGTTKFDLSLFLQEAPEGLTGFLEYDADLFDPSTVDRLLRRFGRLLEGVVEAPEARPWELPLLLVGERQQVVAEWNDSWSDYPRGSTLHELFAAWAHSAPEEPAVVAGGETWSYGRVEEEANRLARHLVELGVGPGARVGVAMERSAEQVVGYLAALKTGAAYVALDPAYPDDRLRFMLEDTAAVVLLVHAATEERLAGLGGSDGAPAPWRQVSIDGERQAISRQSADPLAGRTAPGSLAYVVFTSGSTGRPKGLAVPHPAVVRLGRGINYLSLGPGDRLGHVSAISFDAAVFEIWCPLLNGATVVMIPKEVVLSPRELATHLRRERVTLLFLVTALFNQIVREVPGVFEPLREVHFGGEAVDPAAVRKALGDGAAKCVKHFYGPAESTTFTTWYPVAEVAPGALTVPIGRPVSNTTVYILDRWLQPVPPGHFGELCVGGEGLAWGYLNVPGATAERFVPDPWGGEPGGRMYRTGDRVRLRRDGATEFVGRLDQQVKIRGFRIELEEIQAALLDHPGVGEAVVLAREEPSGTKVLVAYLVPQEAPGPEVGELRTFLAARLPGYMVPTFFVTLDALPLTANGKVDREALPAPDRAAAGGEKVAPRTPAEATLAEIWSRVLGVEAVGVHDNFFDLGGDSILGIQVVSRAQQAGLWLTAKDLFQHQSVAELAAVARAGEGAEASEEEDGAPIPLTPIQRWFFQQELADPHHFNQAILLDLRRKVEAGLLERALAAVVGHHTALRLRFVAEDGEGWRQVPGETAVPLTVVDLSPLPQGQRRWVLEERAARVQASLDLARGPLMRAVLFNLGEGGQRLFLVLHHLIVDGVSWRILLADLEAAYRAVADGGEPALPPVPTSLARWSRKLLEHAGSPEVTSQLDYWLAPARTAVGPLPRDREAGENTVASTREVVTELDPEETEALLKEVPSAYHTRIDEVLLTALAEAVGGWTGEPRLLVDLEGHGREELSAEGPDTSRTVGWLTAVYPMLLELDGGAPDPGERLKSIKEQLRSVPGKGIGYGLLRYLDGSRAADRLEAMPAPEVVFNYLGQLDRGLPDSSLFAAAPESGGAPRSPRQRRGHLLEVNGGISGGRLRLTWTYSESVHEPQTVRELTDAFLAALRGLIEHCRSGEAGGYTPSDFPEARVSQKDLDSLMQQIGKKRTAAAGGSKGR